MIAYRLKIQQLVNGTTLYFPQEGRLKITGGWIKRSHIRWEDIYKKGFDTEEEAIESINNIRKFREKKQETEVKSITYKSI